MESIENRNKIIMVRLTQSEKDKIEEDAMKAHIPTSVYVRYLLFNKKE